MGRLPMESLRFGGSRGKAPRGSRTGEDLADGPGDRLEPFCQKCKPGEVRGLSG